ncbi:amidohydrolase family protein [Verrucomicrobiales bacterium]|nr:amidohydrolase family protein [Verrucomicrobiales bacterium]
MSVPFAGFEFTFPGDSGFLKRMIIDSHHHFWDYDAAEYGWIGEGMDILKKDFDPTNLQSEIEAAGVDGVISVQARTDEKENGFLLNYAKENDFIKGVVGWVDLTAENAWERIGKFAEAEKALGIREVLQGMEDRSFCLRDDFNQGIGALHDFGLTYDVLIKSDQIRAATEMVDKHPMQLFVLDHIAKPEISSKGVDAEWANAIRELAKREHVACKLSGMATEVAAGETVSPELTRPWFDVVLEAFGADRLMFGSDWPVSLLRTTYGDWQACVKQWTAELSPDEQAAIWGKTAMRFYGIDG